MSPLPGQARERAAALVAAAFVGVIATACWINFVQPKPLDFISFWAAGQMALEGRAEAVYDIAAHRSAEATGAPVAGLIPFPYPPPFLLMVMPFGLLPYGVAFAAWVFAGGLLYALAARVHMRPAVALSYPPVLSNGLVGQNGFLTSTIFLFGSRWLDARPALAGAMLGLLVIKPQLGLLLPVALVAGRHWRSIAAAAGSSGALLAAALLAFGAGAYEGFVRILPIYAEFLGSGRWPWNELASPFGFLRYLGVPAAPALAVHSAIAAAAIAIVWRAWRRRWSNRVPVLAAATVLVPPYLFSYDALLLVLPLAAILAERRRVWLVPIVWGLSALPLADNFGLFPAPNGLPLAALLMLASLSAGPAEPRSNVAF